MKKKPTYLTQSGVDKLSHELHMLTTVQRPELAARLRAAIQMGDLSENADYITAKEEQAFLEGRILELQEMLSGAVIINTQTNNEEVSIGATVTIVEGDSPPEKYTLVGPAEADPSSGRISHESPLGKALLGKRIGERTTAHTPAGDFSYEITDIN